MSGNKNKTTKRQRTPRVVPPSEYKRVNRGGSGKPQPRQITAAGRVNGIRTMLKQYAIATSPRPARRLMTTARTT